MRLQKIELKENAGAYQICETEIPNKDSVGISVLSGPAKPVVALRNPWPVSVREKITRRGRSKKLPGDQVGGVLHAERAREGVAESEGDIGAAKSSDVGHQEIWTAGEIMCQNEVQLVLINNSVSVVIPDRQGRERW